MAALLQLFFGMALLAPKAPPPRPPPPLHNPLIIPVAGQNLSAFRLDTEVFGWNTAFTEVGAVAMEMARDPEGAHRGETYLLVYPVRSTTPKHNVICHFITHVALPDNPVPLETAGDYMWTIEFSYQQMWPKRPKRRRPKNAMQVTPLWAPMPATEPNRPAQANPKAVQPPLEQHRRTGTCRPWVGFRLRRGQEVRLHPYRPVDLTARCDLLSLTDSRTYWGTDTVAASMVRFDFNASPTNEESARFVVSSVWEEARRIQFVVAPSTPLAPKAKAGFAAVLGDWGAVRFRPPHSATAERLPQTITIHAAEQWLPMARALALDLDFPDATVVADDTLKDTIMLALGPVAPSHDTAEPPADAAAGDKPAESPNPANLEPHQPLPAARYLNDFKVP